NSPAAQDSQHDPRDARGSNPDHETGLGAADRVQCAEGVVPSLRTYEWGLSRHRNPATIMPVTGGGVFGWSLPQPGGGFAASAQPPASGGQPGQGWPAGG